MIRVTYNTASNTVNVRPLQRTANNLTNDIDREKNVYLIYFKSDMSDRVAYCYTDEDTIEDFGDKRSNYQYSALTFTQVSSLAAEDVYAGKVYLNPAGYWYYIIYEVHFPMGTDIIYDDAPFSLLQPGYAPIDDIGTYEAWGEPGPTPSKANKGVLGIAVEEGKMYVDQEPPAITYTEHTQTNDNYIYTE